MEPIEFWYVSTFQPFKCKLLERTRQLTPSPRPLWQKTPARGPIIFSKNIYISRLLKTESTALFQIVAYDMRKTMDPRQFLKLAPERRLIMTFALRQALEILQMPQLDLAQWLQDEIEKNPLLELRPTQTRKRFEGELP